MFNAEAIKELAKGQAIGAASEAVAVAELSLSLLALPNDFTAHDIERFAINRRRPRGTMTARSIDHFVGYIDQRHQNGATVFVDPADLSATAVLDMGTRDAPGHCDDTASLTMVPTAAYATARSIWHGAQMPQRKAAEWVEDWSDYLTCFDDDGAEIANKHAASALRAIMWRHSIPRVVAQARAGEPIDWGGSMVRAGDYEVMSLASKTKGLGHA